jgi:hypothetical protein
MKRVTSRDRDPRRLPNPDEIRKTTEPLDHRENVPPNAGAVQRPPDRPDGQLSANNPRE